MRIMHVITGLVPGGAENQLRLLLRHTRHEAVVVTLTNPGSVAAAIRSEGTPVVHLGMRSNRDLTAVPKLRKLMRQGSWDVVHTHLYRACLYGRVAARLAAVARVVATEHSLGDGYIEGRRTTAASRLLYLATERMSDATIAVSRTTRDRLVAWGVPAAKVRVVPNGIDMDALAFDPGARLEARRQLALPPSSTVIGAVGRLDPVKRFDVLLEAAIPLLGPDVRLLVVGEGPARGALAERISEAGVAPYVVLAGERADVAPLLFAMDMLVAPSASETFGLAAIEALAAGLPVLYDQCPAIEELPDRAAAKATRVQGGTAELRAAVEATMDRISNRREAHPAVAERFSIRATSRAVDHVYEGLFGPQAELPR